MVKKLKFIFVKEMKNPVMDSCVDATETKKESVNLKIGLQNFSKLICKEAGKKHENKNRTVHPRNVM